MSSPLLSAALIVKDEARFLPACLDGLNALRPLLHEICVYDTGSTDGTIDLAEAAGATVQRGHWDGDFSRARNEALAMCSGTWVLSIDADEVVAADCSRLEHSLRAALKQDMTGFDALGVSIADVREGSITQVFPALRMLRRSRVRWIRPVHEVPAVVHPGRVMRSRDLDTETLVLRHYGYEAGEVNARKMRRNFDIADRLVRELDAQGAASDQIVLALVDRARSALGAGLPEQALGDYERVRRTASSSKYRTWGMEMLADLLIDRSRYAEAIAVVDQLRREGVSDPEYCDWLEARCLLTAGRIAEGMALVRQIDRLRTAAGSEASPELLLDARMQGAMALQEYDEAAVCLIRLMTEVGRISPRSGELLLALWGNLPPEVLVEMILERDHRHLPAVIAEFERFESGHAIARELRSSLAEKSS